MTAALIPTTDRPYQLLPPLTVEQRDLLRQSIKENGVLEPVVFDEDGEILDGHHRVEIAEELGIEYPRRVIDDLDRPGKHMYALTVNVARRQLDHAARGGLVAQMRIRGMSIRRIAEALGVSRGTVANDLAQLSNSGQLEQPERVTGADGKNRPATHSAPKPAQTPGPVVAPSTAPADPGPAEPEPDRHLRAVPDPVVPPSRLAVTPEQRKEIEDEAERVRSIDNARKKADRLVREVSGLITEIEAGVLLGEPGLVTTEMVAGLRAEADRLEKYLEESK